MTTFLLSSTDPRNDDDATDTTRFLGQRCLERLRGVPGRGQVDLPGGADDCGRGRTADITKPMRGLGSGVFEVALPFRGNAFRVVYAVQIADEIWVVHAFQKKSTQGIKTPTREVDLIKDRLKRLKEMLR